MKKEVGAQILPRLREIQAKFGYLPKKEILKLSEELGIHHLKIYETANFYSFLNIEKRGKNVILICNSPSCYLNNAVNVVKTFEEILNLKMGESNKDFTLEFTSCIGCCDNPPAALINGKLFTRLNKDKIKKIIEEVKVSRS